MKTIFIAIACGTSVRDVLRNDTFLKLKEQKNLRLVVLAPQVNDSKFVKEFSGENVEFEELIKFKASFAERILYHFHRAALRDKSKTIDLGNTSGDTSTLNWVTPFARLAIKILGDRGVLKMIHWCYRKFTNATLYESIFNKYSPDLVVVTRVLNYSLDYPVLRMADQKKVPVISCVSSWDNLTSKGFFPFSIKSLVVWNQIIADEAKYLFYFPEKDIFISGIPRYDLFFRREGFQNREKVFERFGLDPARKLIMYGTGSKDTGSTKMDAITPEPEIVEFIADAIEEGKIDSSVQLLVRLHPRANPEHYKKLEGRKNVVVHVPGRDVSFQDRLFSQKDDVEFAESLMHSDLVINLGSTVSIDAAVFNRPIICVNFDFRGERPYKYSMKRMYDFDHYRKLVELGGIRLSESREALITDINAYLKNPELDKAGRQNIVDKQCYFRDGQSGARIANHILSFIDFG
jgi:CDP-glycerol glycerophosphotransferase (TagB/SpsB family)